MATTGTTAEGVVSARPVALEPGITRKVSRVEKLVGPEWYRLLKGVVTNPLSVLGLIIISIFIVVAIFAPVLAPPPTRYGTQHLSLVMASGLNRSRQGQNGCAIRPIVCRAGTR